MDVTTGIQTGGAAIAGIVAVIHFVRLVQVRRPSRQDLTGLSNGELTAALKAAKRDAALVALAENLALMEHRQQSFQDQIREEMDDLRSSIRRSRAPGNTH